MEQDGVSIQQSQSETPGDGETHDCHQEAALSIENWMLFLSEKETDIRYRILKQLNIFRVITKKILKLTSLTTGSFYIRLQESEQN